MTLFKTAFMSMLVASTALTALPALCERLIEHGLPRTTPVAVVQQGTSRDQRVVTGTLATLPGRAARARLKPPTLIIVGSVVTLRDRLAWFGKDA